MPRLSRSALLFFVLLLPRAVAAKAPEGAFPERLRVGGKELVLNGTGLCEWGWFDLYHGGLWLEKPTRDARRICEAKEVKVLRLAFARKLTAAQLRKAWTASVKVNAGKALPRFQKRLAALNRMMVDVEKGDFLTFVYTPGRGLRVLLERPRPKSAPRAKADPRELGRIEGDDFAALYVGANPPDKNLKRGLLRGAPKATKRR